MAGVNERRGTKVPRLHGSVLLATDLKHAKGVPPLEPAALPGWLSWLETLNSEGLHQEWVRRFAAPVPDIRSRDVLRHLIAWRAQVQTLGSLDAETLRRLAGLMNDRASGKPLKPAARLRLSPGTVLTREWKGRQHRVTVEARGFSYEGKRWDSLSEIAREITGTRWSGPRLFGLERDSR